MPPGRERGQTSIEHVSVLVLVAAVLGILFTSGLPSQVASAAERAVCIITNQGDDCGTSTEDGEDPGAGSDDDSDDPDNPGDSGDPNDPNDPGDPGDPNDPGSTTSTTEPLTPREQAEAGDYVAIGDSFSSGEGGGGYEEGTECRRSENAYPERIGDQFDFEGEVHNRTCSGALVHNAQTDGQHDEPPQLDSITDDTSLVTIGIGGNDTGWTDVVQACLLPAFFDGCGDTQEVQDAMDEAAENIVRLYEDAGERAPDDARVVAIGYPRFFPGEPDETYSYCIGVEVPLAGCSGPSLDIDPDNQRWMNERFREFNDLLAEKADEAGIEFVDMYDAFEGCELTTDDACMHGLKADLSEWPPVHSDSFHPNADGQGRMSDLVAEQIENPQ